MKFKKKKKKKEWSLKGPGPLGTAAIGQRVEGQGQNESGSE